MTRTRGTSTACLKIDEHHHSCSASLSNMPRLINRGSSEAKDRRSCNPISIGRSDVESRPCRQFSLHATRASRRKGRPTVGAGAHAGAAHRWVSSSCCATWRSPAITGCCSSALGRFSAVSTPPQNGVSDAHRRPLSLNATTSFHRSTFHVIQPFA